MGVYSARRNYKDDEEEKQNNSSSVFARRTAEKKVYITPPKPIEPIEPASAQQEEPSFFNKVGSSISDTAKYVGDGIDNNMKYLGNGVSNTVNNFEANYPRLASALVGRINDASSGLKAVNDNKVMQGFGAIGLGAQKGTGISLLNKALNPETEARYQAEREASPWLSGAGELAGYALPFGAAGKVISKLPVLAKPATTLMGKVGQGALKAGLEGVAVGGAMGGASGAIDYAQGKGTLQDAGNQALNDALTFGAGGAVIGGGLPVLGSLAKKGFNGIKNKLNSVVDNSIDQTLSGALKPSIESINSATNIKTPKTFTFNPAETPPKTKGLKGSFIKDVKSGSKIGDIETYKNNLQAIEKAKTGEPIQLTGFRNSRGNQVEGTGEYYALDPRYAGSYSKNQKAFINSDNTFTKSDNLVGDFSSLKVNSLEFKNPLVEPKGSKYNVARALRFNDKVSPETKNLLSKATDFKFNNPKMDTDKEQGYAILDKMIAKAAKEAGHDGIIYGTKDFEFGTNKGEIVDLRPSQTLKFTPPIKTLSQKLNYIDKTRSLNKLSSTESPVSTQNNMGNINSPTGNVEGLKANVATEKELPIQDISDRGLNSIGNRKVNAYQYDHPEFKPWYQDYAKNILDNEFIPAKKGWDGELERSMQSDITRKLKESVGSYAEIKKGLEAIIKDNGAENIAAAKRVETVIDDILTNGYKSTNGEFSPPAKAYIEMKNQLTGKVDNTGSDEGLKLLGIDLQNFGKGSKKLPKLKNVNTGKYTRIENKNKEMDRLGGNRDLVYSAPEKMPSTLNDVVPTFKKETSSVKDLGNKLYTRFFDTKHPIKLADEATYKQAITSGNAQGTVKHILESENVGMEGNAIGESFGSIYRDVGKIKTKATSPQGETKVFDPAINKTRKMTTEDAFNQYLLHKHNVNRMSIQDKGTAKAIENDIAILQQQKANTSDAKQIKTIDKKLNSLESKRGLVEQSQKPVFGDKNYTAEMSDKTAKWYEQQYPEFKSISERLNKEYSKFMDEWTVKSGLFDGEAMKVMREMYPNYVPTNRFFTELEKLTPQGLSNGSFVNKTDIIKRATGSSRNIINPLESIIKNIDKTVKASRSNEVGQRLVNSIRENPEGMAPKAELIEANPQMLDEINQVLKEDGVEGLSDFLGTQFDRAIQKNLKGSNIVTVMENGAPTFVKINDVSLLKAMRGLTESQKGTLEKIGRALTNPFKTVVTGKNPIFAVKNLARDIPNAYINSIVNNPLKFSKDLVVAAKEMTTNGKLWKEYKALGGEHSNFFNDGGKGLMKQKKQLVKGKGVLRKTSDALGTVNNSTESLNRFAEYIRTVEKGGGTYQSKLDGIYNAGEVSTNFGRHGDITKAIDAYVPYLNPAIQGIDKFARQTFAQPGKTIGKSLARTAVKGGIGVTGLTVILDAVNKDDPNYKALDNRTKDTNYLFPRGDGTFTKIPKTRENGVVFGSLIERIARLARGEEDSFKGFDQTVKNNFLPPLDTIFKPVSNLASNKDFAGRSIEPLYMQDREKRDRYNDKTSGIAKALAPLAEKINLSPMQVDYLIRSYMGVVAQFGLPATTEDAEVGKVLLGGFKADPLYNNQSVQDFYENKEKVRLKAGSKSFNDKIEASVVTKEDNLKNSFDKVSKEISDITKKINKTSNPDEIKKLRKQMIDKAAEVNKKLPKLK